NALLMSGEGVRSVQTRSIDTTGGGQIRFDLRIANGFLAPWVAGTLPRDGIVLEYSTSAAASWSELGRYDSSVYFFWTTIVVNLPPAARSPNTQFRWRQLDHSGSDTGNWALDNVGGLTGPRAPIITSPPTSRSVTRGDSTSFSVGAFGSPPLSYQWRFNGTNVVESARISGVTNAVLTIASTLDADVGNYSVVVSNAFGTVTSPGAVLTVNLSDHFAVFRPSL